MHCLYEGQDITLSKETTQNVIFFRIMPLLSTFLTFCNISIITGDIDLKLGVCVHYPGQSIL